ncbi:MAG: hypothetical protein IJA60_02680 [Clostridia bacterium]|nr:hypothetical protein [Clostridia bacterium]
MPKYYSDDITWCSKDDCDIIQCERNRKNMRKTMPFSKCVSVADLEGTSFCIKKKEINNG